MLPTHQIPQEAAFVLLEAYELTKAPCPGEGGRLAEQFTRDGIDIGGKRGVLLFLLG
jgi:hypothetical protein